MRVITHTNRQMYRHTYMYTHSYPFLAISPSLPSVAVTNPLSPIAENQEEAEVKMSGPQRPESEEQKQTLLTPRMWRHSEPYRHGDHLPYQYLTSLPELPMTVSPQPPSPNAKARGNWMKAVEVRK